MEHRLSKMRGIGRNIWLGIVLVLILAGGGYLYLQAQIHRHQSTPTEFSGPDTAPSSSPSATVPTASAETIAISKGDDSSPPTKGAPKYLLFYASGANPEVPLGNPATIFTKAQTKKSIDDLIAAIGQVGDHVNTQLGFSSGPLAFDHTDDQLRTSIADSFAVAAERNVAVAFHIDDSMFWNRRKDLWSDKNNIEWIDWKGTTVPHRLIGWAANGAPVLAPPMCYNSPAIQAEATRIARDVIGAEIKKGIDRLNSIGKPYLFAGVIAGWETRMQDQLGSRGEHHYAVYCALHNIGYSAQNPPKDFDKALHGVVNDWIVLWARGLQAAGVPRDSIFTHIAFPGDPSPIAPFTNQIGDHFKDTVPIVTAFNEYSRPGFSVYGADKFPGLYKVLARYPKTPWGISEGTNINLGNPFTGGNSASGHTMEQYLGRAFNHGAVFVNLFGWDPNENTHEFARASAGKEAIAAYRKFLSGAKLEEGETPPPAATAITSSKEFSSKIQQIQNRLPNWLSQHPDQRSAIRSLMPTLDAHMRSDNVAEANKVADKILSIISGAPATIAPTSPGSSGALSVKIQRIQGSLPNWLSQHPDQGSAVLSLMPTLDAHMRSDDVAEADKVADKILSIISGAPATIAPTSPGSSGALSVKIQRIQGSLPNWINQHPDQQRTLQSLLPRLDGYMRAGNLTEAEKVADQVLAVVGQADR